MVQLCKLESTNVGELFYKKFLLPAPSNPPRSVGIPHGQFACSYPYWAILVLADMVPSGRFYNVADST